MPPARPPSDRLLKLMLNGVTMTLTSVVGVMAMIFGYAGIIHLLSGEARGAPAEIAGGIALAFAALTLARYRNELADR